MPAFHAEALLFAVAWAALAIGAGLSGGWPYGAAFSLGLLLLVMPTSILIVTRTENFRLERVVRWTWLAVGIGLFLLLRAR